MTFGDLFAIVPPYIAMPLMFLLVIGIGYLGLWAVLAAVSRCFGGSNVAGKTARTYHGKPSSKRSNAQEENEGLVSVAANAITYNYASDQYKADQERIKRQNSPEYGGKSLLGSPDDIFD